MALNVKPSTPALVDHGGEHGLAAVEGPVDVDPHDPDRGRLEAGLYADIVAVPGDVLTDITVTEDIRFVMKGGQVYRNEQT